MGINGVIKIRIRIIPTIKDECDSEATFWQGESKKKKIGGKNAAENDTVWNFRCFSLICVVKFHLAMFQQNV